MFYCRKNSMQRPVAQDTPAVVLPSFPQGKQGGDLSLLILWEKDWLMARSKFKHKRKRHKANVKRKRREERAKHPKDTEEKAGGS